MRFNRSPKAPTPRLICTLGSNGTPFSRAHSLVLQRLPRSAHRRLCVARRQSQRSARRLGANHCQRDGGAVRSWRAGGEHNDQCARTLVRNRKSRLNNGRSHRGSLSHRTFTSFDDGLLPSTDYELRYPIVGALAAFEPTQTTVGSNATSDSNVVIDDATRTYATQSFTSPMYGGTDRTLYVSRCCVVSCAPHRAPSPRQRRRLCATVHCRRSDLARSGRRRRTNGRRARNRGGHHEHRGVGRPSNDIGHCDDVSEAKRCGLEIPSDVLCAAMLMDCINSSRCATNCCQTQPTSFWWMERKRRLSTIGKSQPAGGAACCRVTQQLAVKRLLVRTRLPPTRASGATLLLARWPTNWRC